MKRTVSTAILAIATLLMPAFMSASNVIMQGNDGKYGVVDASGRWIIQPVYEYITYEEEFNLYKVTKSFNGDNTGLCDAAGRMIVPATYFSFNNIQTSSIVKFYGKSKPLDYVILVKSVGDALKRVLYSIKEQRELIPAQYNYIDFYNGFITGRRDHMNPKDLDCWDMEGNQILSGVDNFIAMDPEGGHQYIYFEKDGLKGVYDHAVRKIILAPRAYDFVGVTSDHKSFEVHTVDAAGERHRTYLDMKGKEIVPIAKYDWIDPVADNLYRVLKNGKYGLYANGKEIVKCQFDAISDFNDGVAQFTKDGEVRLIKNPLIGDAGPEIAELLSAATKKRKDGGPAISRYPAAESDVDSNLPKAKGTQQNMFAFIIANENYPDAPVPYALNDGRAFRKYCSESLGIPDKNITMLEDATYGTIIGAVEKLKSVADAYDGEASAIIYYAGHGFPDEKQQSAYLLPIDGNGSDIVSTGFSLTDFYKTLNSIKLKSSVVLLDACFSGTKREDDMLASSRGVAIKVKEEAPQGNMVVFSASQGDETAHQMEENRHGLFTYFLLKSIKELGPEASLGELTDYVTKQVKRQSVVINNKRQTPTVIPSASIGASWRDIRLH